MVNTANRRYSVWTKYTLAGMSSHLSGFMLIAAAIPGSFLFAMVALPLYAIIAPLLNFSLPFTGIVPRLWADAIFYFVLLLFPIVCLLRDYMWK